MTRRAAPEDDAFILKYAGALGHTFVIVIDNAPTKSDPRTRRTALETCDRMGAVTSATGEYADRHPIVYQQVKIGKWKRVFG